MEGEGDSSRLILKKILLAPFINYVSSFQTHKSRTWERSAEIGFSGIHILILVYRSETPYFLYLVPTSNVVFTMGPENLNRKAGQGDPPTCIILLFMAL